MSIMQQQPANAYKKFESYFAAAGFNNRSSSVRKPRRLRAWANGLVVCPINDWTFAASYFSIFQGVKERQYSLRSCPGEERRKIETEPQRAGDVARWAHCH